MSEPTEAQIEASRRNGTLSHGPNSLKHGTFATSAGRNYAIHEQQPNTPEIAALDMPARPSMARCQNHEKSFPSAELTK